MANPFLYPEKPLKTDVERVVLEKLFVNVNASVPMRDLASVHRDQIVRMGTIYNEISPVIDHMLFTMSVWLMKSVHVDKRTTTVDVPVTWWDHVKHDMRLSTKRWVVWLAMRFDAPKYNTILQDEIHETRVCPHNNTYFSESGDHIHYLLWKDGSDRLG